MFSELLVAVLVYHALLDHVGTWVGQGVQKVSSLFDEFESHRIGIRYQDAVADDGGDLTISQLASILEQS